MGRTAAPAWGGSGASSSSSSAAVEADKGGWAASVIKPVPATLRRSRPTAASEAAGAASERGEEDSSQAGGENGQGGVGKLIVLEKTLWRRSGPQAVKVEHADADAFIPGPAGGVSGMFGAGAGAAAGGASVNYSAAAAVGVDDLGLHVHEGDGGAAGEVVVPDAELLCTDFINSRTPMGCANPRHGEEEEEEEEEGRRCQGRTLLWNLC